jgi:hypothetical protein
MPRCINHVRAGGNRRSYQPAREANPHSTLPTPKGPAPLRASPPNRSAHSGGPRANQQISSSGTETFLGGGREYNPLGSRES